MVNLGRNSIDSKMLSWLRFPLAVLIVFIHTDYSHNPQNAVYYVGKFLSDGVSVVAVPTFFFISGYLFFSRYDSFGLKEYTSVITRKFHTLVAPYLLWISVVYYSYGFYSGQVTHINLSPSELYKIFWASSDGIVTTSPLGYKFSLLSIPSGVGALWFVRDLIVCMLLSPIIWMIIKRLKMWSIVFFSIPYFCFIGIPIIGFGHSALFFFPMGAVFSICGKNISDFTIKWGKTCFVIFAILFLSKYILDINLIKTYSVLLQCVILAGIGAVLYLSYIFLKYERSATWIILLGEASFFIYVCHQLPIFLLLHPITETFNNIPGGETIAYFFSWGFRLTIVTGSFFILKKFCPKLLSVLVGGRS